MGQAVRRWEDLTWHDLRGIDADRTVVVLPVAAIEQHGPHLPLATDAIINRGILEAHLSGILTSTSLLVNARGSEEAGELRRRAPGLSVGLHVDLGGDPATGYRVYISDDGYGWSDATAVSTGTNFAYVGLTPGKVYYFKVSATNAGGESFPTETIAARVGPANPPLLLVSGFDRIDRSALIAKNDTIGTNYRMDLRRMNSYDYVVAHGEAIGAANVNFDVIFLCLLNPAPACPAAVQS